VFRLALAPIALLTLFTFVLQPAHTNAAATTLPFGRTAKVIVQLKGQPLVANLTFKRQRAPGFHAEVDARLPAAQTYLHALGAYRSQEIAFLRGTGLDLTVGYQYGAVLNGFSATVPVSQLSKLSSAPNVVAVFPDREYARPMLDHSIPLINAPAAWAMLGGGPSAGKNLYIADVDTGIQISDPCFSGANMPAPKFGLRSDTAANRKYTNNKVVVARAFGPNSKKKYSAADQVGHGTSTAGIEACDYNTPTPLGTKASGVAPDAYLMNYNVFPGKTSGASDSALAAALNAATLDGADVINMSLGQSSTDWRLDPLDLIVQQLTRAGYVVSVSAGNSDQEAQSVGEPADSPTAMGVGAVTNSQAVLDAHLTVTGPNVPADLQTFAGDQGSHPWSQTVGPAEVVPVGLGRKPGDDPSDKSADDYAGKDLTGKIALIQRGILTFQTKVDNAAKAGAIGAIIYNNLGGATALTGVTIGTATLPTSFISQTQGQELLQYVQQNPTATVTMNGKYQGEPQTPGLLSDYTSVGPAAHYAIKPDLVAPGDIFAPTQSKYKSGEEYNPTGWAYNGGTSFSSPHVAGAAALVLQAHPKWTTAQVQANLMNNASLSVFQPTSSGTVPSVMQMGAGLLNVGAAVAAPAMIMPASVSFDEVNSAYGAVTKRTTLTLSNISNGTGTWQASVKMLHSESGVSIAAPSSVALSGSSATFALQARVQPGIAPADVDGYVLLTKGTVSLHVPFFIHVMSHKVAPKSVLLVDETASRFTPPLGQPPLKHLAVAKYYENALRGLHQSFTYWDVSKLGTPPVSDMKRASLVIYFTGNNLNDFSGSNSNYEATGGPLGPTDIAALNDYTKAGGNVFISGTGAVFGAAVDPSLFLELPAGTIGDYPSLYDTTTNDKKSKGGVSPPKPSMVPDGRKNQTSNPHMFGGLKAIDISTKFGGDGAKDNLAVNNPAIGLLIGVVGMEPADGTLKPLGTAYGEGVLRATGIKGAKKVGTDVAVTNSQEPSFKHPAITHRSRTLVFSFGFEGINNNTGYATRTQVMRRILDWFSDRPTVSVNSPQSVGGLRDRLRVRYSGAKPIQYTWQVNGQTLAGSRMPTIHQFGTAGRYHVRVMVTDKLGHTAVSPLTWITIQR